MTGIIRKKAYPSWKHYYWDTILNTNPYKIHKTQVTNKVKIYFFDFLSRLTYH